MSEPQIITMGAGYLYLAELGVARPGADVPYLHFEQWPEGWLYVGLTDGGIEVSVENTLKEIMSDQTLSAVDYGKTGEKLTMKTKLIQSSLKNLQLIWGGQLDEVQKSGTTPHHYRLRGGGDNSLQKFQWAIESAWNDNGTPRMERLMFTGISSKGTALMYKKDDVRAFSLEVAGVADRNQPPGRQLWDMYQILGDA